MAEGNQEVSVISRSRQETGVSPSEGGSDAESLFDGLESELLSLIIPEALSRLYYPRSSTAVEDSRTDPAVTMTDNNGFEEVAGILHQTLTTFENWLYETPDGKMFQTSIRQEFPELPEELLGEFRSLLQFLAQPLGQLKDRTHPHFKDIERWFANYHVLIKTAVNFLHGGLVALMNSNAFKGHSTLDPTRIVKEVAGIFHQKMTDLTEWVFGTSEGLALLRSFLLHFPENNRPDEKELYELFQGLTLPLIQLKDGSHPVFADLEQGFADCHFLVQMTVEFFHGGVVGLMNNEACQALGSLDLTKTFTEIARAFQQTSVSINQWLFQTPKGIAILRSGFLELVFPIRTNEEEYRNVLTFIGLRLIQMKNSAEPLFQLTERFLVENHDVLTKFVLAFHGCVAWYFNNLGQINLLYINALHILYEINERNGCPVSRRLFWLNGLEGSTTLASHFVQYHRDASSSLKVFTWLDVPYLLNVRTKWKFLSLQAVDTMERVMKKAAAENVIRQQSQLPTLPTSLQFQVDRSNIVHSAIENVEKYWQDSESSNPIWLKPLVVNFIGESAIDFGGPSKDFFGLFFSTLFSTNTSIFRTIDEQSVASYVWFNPENSDYCILEKIGLLFALSIFHGAITPLPFPELLYEKLLSDRDPIPTDLKNIDKGFVNELHKLRDMAAEDLEALELDLPGDENVCVTKDNLEMYIEQTMNNRLAIPQLQAFAKGFNRLASMMPLLKKIFRAEDLRDLILGEELDWKAFRQSARYQLPYCDDHPVIIMFWKVFEELEEREKRKFLKFLTGADHVPVGGFVPFPIRRLDHRADRYRHPIEPDKYPEPGDLMPEVMTCRGFLSMDLPEYQTEENLRNRLKMAINVDGFHREDLSCSHSHCTESLVAQRVVQVACRLIFGGTR